MSKIARYTGNLPAFGSSTQGLERTVFGGTVQPDDLTSQVTDAFLRGWEVPLRILHWRISTPRSIRSASSLHTSIRWACRSGK